MSPATAYALTGYPKAQVIILGVGIQNVLDNLRVTTAADTGNDIGTTLLGLELIAVTELEELEVGISVVGVTCNALQTAKEKGLTQRVQILAKGIEKLDKILALIAL